MKKLLKNTKLLLLIASIIVAIAMALIYVFAVMPKGVEGEKNITLKINYAENQYAYNLTTDKETVFEVLTEYNEIYDLKLVTDDTGYGAFITSMKGVSQDVEKGYYYSYTLNGAYAPNGISTQTIKDGDVLEFRYSYTEYDENWNIVSDTLMGKGETAGYIKTLVIMISIAGVILIAGVAYFVVCKIREKRDV
ncbi:MAG: DUF4430 domain-containing protein [Clostridiales bacterium]|nr:DUF4430 domain-containing protein [Clostridiales bacterium]